jgi:hypothetical protein
MMANPTRIFIGSSSEALKVAKLVARAITEAGDGSIEPVIWNRDAFVLGMTLLETIESLPLDYHGAVLVATPDKYSSRGDKTVWDPVPNVVFEYGYLAARLTRKRVAICKFGEAEIPSDLQGLKVVEVKDYDYKEPSALPKTATKELRSWLNQLPRLADKIPPVSQVHGYSGTWNVESRFSLWRGLEVEPPDKVYFDGKTFLVLQDDGESGSGVQIGKLYILIGDYRATYEIVNQILAASVDAKGTLRMRLKVVRREGPKDKQGKPNPKLSEGLANKEFDLELKPRPGKSKTLQGRHEYRSATVIYQRASEHWGYAGLFGSSCL